MNRFLVREPGETTDAMLLSGQVLHAEAIAKVVALGKVWNGGSTPVDDMQVAALGEALGTLPAPARAKIAAIIQKASGAAPKVDGTGTVRVSDTGGAAMRAWRDQTGASVRAMQDAANKMWATRR